MRKTTSLITACLLLLATHAVAQRVMERLNRGVVAVRSGSSVFISWRMLGLDPAEHRL